MVFFLILSDNLYSSFWLICAILPCATGGFGADFSANSLLAQSHPDSVYWPRQVRVVLQTNYFINF